MAFGQYSISDVNPNDTTGGGGTVSDERAQIDVKGPYVIFRDTRMASEHNLSPYVVISKSELLDCLRAIEQAEKDNKVLRIGEADKVAPTPKTKRSRKADVEPAI